MANDRKPFEGEWPPAFAFFVISVPCFIVSGIGLIFNKYDFSKGQTVIVSRVTDPLWFWTICGGFMMAGLALCIVGIIASRRESKENEHGEIGSDR